MIVLISDGLSSSNAVKTATKYSSFPRLFLFLFRQLLCQESELTYTTLKSRENDPERFLVAPIQMIHIYSHF